MKRMLNESAKTAIALVLGLVCLWFVMSFAWSLDDMSLAECVFGAVYVLSVVPLYEGIKRLLGLR